MRAYKYEDVAVAVTLLLIVATQTTGAAIQSVAVWSAQPNITSFAPPSPVSNNEGETRTFNISINQIVNVSWLINGNDVFTEYGVNESVYTNTSAVVGYWNVSAIVNNTNGTDTQTWWWNVTEAPPIEQNNPYNVTNTTTTDGNIVTIDGTIITGNVSLEETVLIELPNGTMVIDIAVNETDNTTGIVTSVTLDTPDVSVNPSLNRTADIDINLNSSVWTGEQIIVLTIQILNDLHDTVVGWNGTAVGANATNAATLAMSGLGLIVSDGGTAIMLHVELSGINESDVLSLPINMTVDGAWYRDVADSKLTNVYLFKFYANGTIKEQENPTSFSHDVTNDTYTFYFVMPGFSTFALVGGKPTPSAPSHRGGTYPPGWGETPTPTVTPTATPTAPPEAVTPTPMKPAIAEETPTKKKGIPGFTAVFAITGMLAIAYLMLLIMRRKK